MDITVAAKDSYQIVSLTGRLDSVTSITFEEWASVFVEKLSADMIIDFSEVDYISSAGLRVLLNISKSINTSPYHFAICNMQDHVREVFMISGFDSIIKIPNSLDDCFT